MTDVAIVEVSAPSVIITEIQVSQQIPTSVVNIPGVSGPPGAASSSFSPDEFDISDASIANVVALAQRPMPSHKLFVNGLLQKQSSYSISETTLTIPASLIWNGAECIFHYS